MLNKELNTQLVRIYDSIEKQIAKKIRKNFPDGVLDLDPELYRGILGVVYLEDSYVYTDILGIKVIEDDKLSCYFYRIGNYNGTKESMIKDIDHWYNLRGGDIVIYETLDLLNTYLISEHFQNEQSNQMATIFDP